MFSWLRQMRASFGISFLWLVVLIYFTQGFRTLVWMAVSFQLKDMLKLSPSASQFLVSIANSPWSIKPLYGILSDCIPIQGRKQLPYLILATFLSLFPWLVIGLLDRVRSSSASLTVFLTLQSLGSAMTDVVIDAMIAESVRFERASYAGDLHLISWSAMAFGGISGSLLGGYSLANMKVHNIFIIFSMFPFIQLLSCALVEEASFSSPNSFNENSADAPICGSLHSDKTKENSSTEYVTNTGKLMAGNGWSSIQSKELTKALEEIDIGLDRTDSHSNLDAAVASNDFGTMRRRRNMNENDESRNVPMQPEIVKHHKPLRRKWISSLKSGFYGLSQAIRQPIIRRKLS